MANTSRPIVACVVLVMTVIILSSTSGVLTQRSSPAAGPWSGQAQCVLVDKSADYLDEQTHTWTLTGAAPTPAPRGSAQVYYTWPATWRVQGSGRKTYQPRTPGGREESDRWTIANEMNVTIRTTEIAGAQVRVRVGVEGQRGGPLGSIRVTDAAGRTRDATVQPWTFPTIEDDATRTTINGSSTRTYPEGVGLGFGRPPKAITTATCTWNFTRGGVDQSSVNTPAGGRGRPEEARGTLGTTATTSPTPQTPVSNATVTSSAPRATSISLADAADLETVVRRDPTAGSGTSWTRNGTARYLVSVTNRGPVAASGAVLTVPPSSGLNKQGAICSATNAQCPAGLTTSSLESGVSLPAIPVGGTIAVSFFASVTGQAGTAVTATSTVRSAATPDANSANNSSTLSHTIEASTTADPSMDLQVRLEPDPRGTTYWQPNATARYRVTIGLYGIPTFSPTTTADGAVLAVPAGENLSKTSVTCTESGGAHCPATVTVAQLESGIVIPRLPDGGTVTFAFTATVTGPLGGSVTVRSVAAPPIGYVRPDSSLLNAAQTQPILVASGSSGGDALAALPASTPGVLTTVPSSCGRPGPVVATPTVTFNSLSLKWQHINGASYTVTRDGQVLTPNPITSAVYPATLTFSHSAPFSRNTTYVYTVTASYAGGCGESRVSFVGPAPWVPLIASYSATAPGTSPRSVTIEWRFPNELTSDPEAPCTTNALGLTSCPGRLPAADNTGFLVVGPGLPLGGAGIWGCTTAPWNYQEAPYPPFIAAAPTRELCLTYVPEVYLPRWAITVPVSPGTYTWTVVPYWDTANGRLADVSAGARVTVTVP